MDLRVSAEQYAAGVADGSISAEEFVAATLERARSSRIHAYLHIDESAVERARAVDKKGEKGPFCGMPVSVKDNICTAKTPTTCASRMLEGYVSPFAATAVERLEAQDAVIVGKTNMDEFAMGITTEFSAYGPTLNPWNHEYVPGGSSGGAAAALAALQCCASLGSDTGGSVRNPASFCGVVGFKPTYGAVSRYGLVPYANSIEQIGPMARTVRDAAWVFDAISGADPRDPTSRAAPAALEGIEGGVEGRKFGVVKEMGGDDAGVSRALSSAVSQLEGAGAEFCEVSLSMIEYSVAAYYVITSTEAGSNLARFDNVRYGYEMPLDGYEFNAYVSRARARLGPEVTRRMILGGFVPSAGHAGKYFLKALKVKHRLEREVEDAFGRVDYMISPTVPVPPFKIGEKIDEPVTLFKLDANTVTANLSGTPSVSVPHSVCGGLPVGIQISGRAGDDAGVLRAARALELRARFPGVPG